MAIVVACRCGKRFAAPQTLAGSTRKCPACGAKIDVTESSSTVDVEDWLFDSLSDNELTSIAELTRSGAAVSRQGASSRGRGWFQLVRGPDIRKWAGRGRDLLGRVRFTPLTTGLCLLTALAPIVLIAFLVWQLRGASRLAAEKAWVVENGEPLSLQELSDSYRLASDENDVTKRWLGSVAPLDDESYERHAHALAVVDFDEARKPLPAPGGLWTDLWRYEQLLTVFHEELASLHDAADAPGGARYPLEFEVGSGSDRQRHLLLERGARLLSIEAHVRAHQGETQGTVDSLHALSRLACTFQEEPSLRAHRRMVVCTKLACDRLRRVLGHVEFSAAQFEELRGDLKAIDLQESLHTSLVGERVQAMAAMGKVEGAADPDDGKLLHSLVNATDEDAATFLVFMNRAVYAAQLPMAEGLQEAEAADRQLASQVENSLWGDRRFKRSEALAPRMQELFSATADCMALQAAADTALAAELHRRDSGRWPSDVRELAPRYTSAVPTDPRSGRPLRCGLHGGSFFLACDGGDKESLGPGKPLSAETFVIPFVETSP